MAEVGFVRRAAPAAGLAVAGIILLYLLPSGADPDTASGEDIGVPDTSAAPTAKASSGTGGNAKRTIQGDPVNFRYGTVQAQVALDGTTISDIATLTAPGGNYQAYTNRAIPGMKAEIIAAQSTRVASVSGATYTSEAYAQSVQSALDKA